MSFLYPASPLSAHREREIETELCYPKRQTQIKEGKKTVKVQLVLGTTYPKHLKNDGGKKEKHTQRETHTRRKKACPEGMLTQGAIHTPL